MSVKSKVITDTVTDLSTGEMVSHSKTETTAFESEPPYVKMYISDIVRIKSLPQGSTKVLFELVATMGYNNTIATYKPFKMMIATKLGLSLSYVEDCISGFIKKGLFIKIARGMYVADPSLFARGRWADIKELRLSIVYTDKKEGTTSKKLSGNITEEMQLKLNM